MPAAAVAKRIAASGGTVLFVRDATAFDARRRAAGLSHLALAKAVGCHKSAVGHWCSGFRNTITSVLADRVAEALSVDVDSLFVAQMPTDERQAADDSTGDAEPVAAQVVP